MKKLFTTIDSKNYYFDFILKSFDNDAYLFTCKTMDNSTYIVYKLNSENEFIVKELKAKQFCNLIEQQIDINKFFLLDKDFRTIKMDGPNSISSYKNIIEINKMLPKEGVMLKLFGSPKKKIFNYLLNLITDEVNEFSKFN